MSIHVLDTYDRLERWKEAFSAAGELLSLAEADMHQPLTAGMTFFIHETDFGCHLSDANFREARYREIKNNYGGNATRAEAICARIMILRQRLRVAALGAQPILLLYSGDEHPYFADRNPVGCIQRHVLPGYSADRIVLVPQITREIPPNHLRLLVETCLHSLAHARCMATDLKTAKVCLENLNALRLFDRPDTLPLMFHDKIHREAVSLFLSQRVQPSAMRLLDMNESVVAVLQKLSTKSKTNVNPDH